jgi:hypothetical protein
VGSRSCARYFASFAFNKPRWYSVAYFGRVVLSYLDWTELGLGLPCFSALWRWFSYVYSIEENKVGELTPRHLLWNCMGCEPLAYVRA